MIRFLLLVTFSLISLSATAQIINAATLQSLKPDSIQKKIIGNADYFVVYDYIYIPNPLFPSKKQKGQTFLHKQRLQ